MSTTATTTKRLPFNDSPTLRRPQHDQDRAMSAHFYAVKGTRSDGEECWRLYRASHTDASGARAFDVKGGETFDTWQRVFRYVERAEAQIAEAESAARAYFRNLGREHGHALKAPDPTVPKQDKLVEPALALAWYLDGYEEGARAKLGEGIGTTCGGITYGDPWPLAAIICAQPDGHDGLCDGEAPDEVPAAAPQIASFAPPAPAPAKKGK